MNFKQLNKGLRSLKKEGLFILIKRIKLKLVLDLIEALTKTIRVDHRNDITKKVFANFVQSVNQIPKLRILEVGSGETPQIKLFNNYSEYTRFDINPGSDVDVVGDIHKLSACFPENHFDVVLCTFVYEHLALPWKATSEINKVLKLGGKLLIQTHPIYIEHSKPCDFWRYFHSTMLVLLNSQTGFKIVDWAEGQPAIILPLTSDPKTKMMYRIVSYLHTITVAEKISESIANFKWDLDVSKVGLPNYPADHGIGNELDLFKTLKGVRKITERKYADL